MMKKLRKSIVVFLKYNNIVASKILLLTICLFCFSVSKSEIKQLFVRNSGTNLILPLNGSDWQHALPNINSALDSANIYKSKGHSVRIYVAKGTYTGNYTISDIAIIGGFPIRTTGKDTTGAFPDSTICKGVSPIFTINGTKPIYLSGLTMSITSFNYSSKPAIYCNPSTKINLDRKSVV